MNKGCSIGLDVHKETIVIAVAEEGSAEAQVLGVFPHDVPKIIKRIAKRGGDPSRVRICYEAGPTGFGLCRRLPQAGSACGVVAPSLVPQQVGLRVKTDRKDALWLAHFLRSGDLTAVWVPDEETDALRDLERLRDDAKNAERVTRLSRDVARFVDQTALAPLVKAWQALRGISVLRAVILAAEIGDLRRFPTARPLMAFLGLVPSEHSSGQTVRRGPLTRTGNVFVRRILVEAAQQDRHRPRLSVALRKRQQGVSPEVCQISWKAQQRRCARRTYRTEKGLPRNKAIVALARELAGFVWAIGQVPEPLAT